MEPEATSDATLSGRLAKIDGGRGSGIRGRRRHTFHRGLGAHAASGDEAGCKDCLWGRDVHFGFR